MSADGPGRQDPSCGPGWNQVEDLFFQAVELPEEEREAWIHQAAGGDTGIESEVRSLIQAHFAAETAARVPRRVGAYLLDRLIGQGGMGDVWLVSRADGQFEQQAALKLVRPGLGAQILLPRFQRERQLLARLNHPNITRLLDGGVSSDGRPYLVMEYVEGEPILDFCQSRKLDVRERIELFRALCSAVEYAHQNLIVHRDIKPGNVLVTSGGVPKLLDFGIAKLTEGEEALSSTLPLLTFRYASPEQLRGEPVTTATDVYSLGVLLFELLTGALPYTFAGETLPDVIAAVTTQEAPRASSVKCGGAHPVPPGDLDAILAKALEKSPARRYASVERLSGDLLSYLEGRPVEARVPSTGYRIRKYVGRHRVGVAAAAIVILSLGLASAVSIRSAQTANQQRKRAERVTQFLEDTLASADAERQGAAFGRGAETRLSDLLPDAAAHIDTAFAGDPVAQARLHRVLSHVYMSLEQFPQAEAEAKAAMERLPSLANDPVDKAWVLFVTGTLDYRLSHRVGEERNLREAVNILERTPELRADVGTHAIFLCVLAAALADIGKKKEAEQNAERAIQLMNGVRSIPLIQEATIHSQLALTFLKIGQLERARTSAQAAVRTLTSSPQPLKATADMAMWLGMIERTLGNPSGALAAFEKSVEASNRVLGANHPLGVPFRIQLAYQRALGGDAAGSIEELSSCLKQARAGSSPEDLFFALHTLGHTLTLAGRPREGELLSREALTAGIKILSPKGPSMGMCDLALGESLERQGRLTQALPLYRTAHENLSSYYGADNYTARQAEAHLRRVEQVSRRQPQ